MESHLQKEFEDIRSEFEKTRKAFEKHGYDDLKHFGEMAENQKLMGEKLDLVLLQLAPLTEAYNGVMFSKKFIIGLAGVVLAIGAVGAGFVWLINHAITK